MKNIFFAVFFTGVVFFCNTATAKNSGDPVIMTIGGEKVPKSEFEYMWKKNNSSNVVDAKTLDEYVDLFINFKLKVLAAKDAGIDTTEAFLKEFNKYRSELAAPYLTDSTVKKNLIAEAYDRAQIYTGISHILIRVAHDASPVDTLGKYKRIMMIYNLAKKKNADFASLAKEYSEDGSKNFGGYLGTLTGGRLIYTFEKVASSVPVGGISMPFRTKFGYHIVKVHSRERLSGSYRSGHIFKQVRSVDADSAARAQIYAIYDSLQAGVPFGELAMKYSDDRASSRNNGEYGMFTTGTLPYEYESHVFALKKGEYSRPFHSKYGYHIVKAIEFQPFPPLSMFKKNIEGRIRNDIRSDMPRKTLAEKLKKEYNFKVSAKRLSKIDNAWMNYKDSTDTLTFKSILASKEKLFTIGKESFSAGSFARYLKGKNSNYTFAGFDKYVEDKIIDYEDRHLEEKYPDFRNLVNEYREGILLFDISNNNIWNKASLDTAGLKKYFAVNKSKYNWTVPHFKGIIAYCKNDSVALVADKILNSVVADSAVSAIDDSLNKKSKGVVVRIRKGLYAKGDNAVVDSLVFGENKSSKELASFPVRVCSGKILKGGPEEYSDVRGLVVSDYQDFLEKKWIDELRAKYKVHINKMVLRKVKK